MIAPSPVDPESVPVVALACNNHPQQNSFRMHIRAVHLATMGRWSAVILLFCFFVTGILGCGYSVNGSSAGSLLISPSTINFGDVPVGQAANTKISLLNQSAATVNVSSLNVDGQTFSINSQGTLPIVIAPGASYVVQIGFKPVSATSYSGTFSAMDSSGRQLVQSSISGSGTDANAGTTTTPQLTVNPTGLSFDNLTVGSSANQTVTLTSTGTAPVQVTAAAISGAGFTLSGASFPVTLNPKQAITLAVQFKPTAVGAVSGNLTISSNSAANPTAGVSLNGTGTSAATSSPQLTVNPGSLTFEDVTVGSTSTQPVTLTSTGTEPVEITSAAVTGGTSFTISGASFPLTLDPKQTITLQVHFTPKKTGIATGTLEIRSNSSTSSMAAVGLSGTGTTETTPTLTVNPGSLSFGNVTVGSSATQSVTLASTGTAPVQVTTATISGAGFTVSGASFPVTLNPKQTVTLTVQFKPTTSGAASGKLAIVSNSSVNPTAAISLSGTGTTEAEPTLTVNPGSLSFGNVTVGSSATQSVALASTGAAPVKVTAAAISGTGFTVSGASFPVTLSPKQVVTLNVQFRPTASGAALGKLTLSSDSSSSSTATISLTGTGTESTTPTLTVNPASLSFGNVSVGSSATQAVTLASTGTAPVQVNATAISGAGFTVSGASFPVTLNPKQAVTLAVQFKPTTSGAATGRLTINSNSSTNPTAAVALAGTGTTAATPTLTVNLASLSFGDVTVGSSATQSVILTSTGTGPVQVNTAAISGTGFTVSGANFPVTLNPKQAVTLTVQFKPTTAGAVSGKLTINSNSSTNPTAVVSLSGTGASTTPQLTLGSSSLSFGNVTVDSSSTQSVTLASSGTGPLTINAATVSGTGFTVSGAPFPVTLNPKQSVTLTVQFKPAATGAFTGKLTVTSNSSTNPTATVSLSGTGGGEQHQVDLSWSEPSNSPVPVTGYNIYRAVGGGSAYQLLNSSMGTQTTYVDSTVQSGMTYSYEVKSVDSSGVESSPSNVISVTIP
jgi:Abnormal spindle-like microcephaly-assoc'd, ASPM-SPD-2-Hydin